MHHQDLLLHLELPTEHAEQRGGFGEERYEVASFQKLVKSKFAEMYATLQCVEARVIDVTGLGVEELGTRLEAVALETIRSDARPSQDRTLW